MQLIIYNIYFIIITITNVFVIEVQIVEIRIFKINGEQWLSIFNEQLCDQAAKAEIFAM